MRSPRPTDGLTLVELLVSIALMTILTGSVVFVFIQAQTIFAHVDAKVQVYQNARTALDAMERDFANVKRSVDMEFFNDMKSPALGHYDPTVSPPEAIPISGAEDDDSIFNYAFTCRQPAAYTGITDKRQYRHDSVYFKTVTTVQDETTAALVEYALEDTGRERPKLVRRLWHVTGFDATASPPKLIVNGNKTSAQPDKQDLCLYVVDCEFSIYVQNKRTGASGTYYSAQEMVEPPRVQPANTDYVFPPMRNVWTKPAYEIMTFYDPSHDDSGTPDFGLLDKDQGGLFRTQKNYPFPMLAPGDRIFLFDADPPPPGSPNGVPFPTGDYTIKKIEANGLIEFAEPISLAAYGPGGSAPRTVTLAYRAGWLPPAVRCVLKIKDAKAKELRTISRTFKVLAA